MILSWGKAVKINSAPFVLPPSKTRPPAPQPPDILPPAPPGVPVKGPNSGDTPVTDSYPPAPLVPGVGMGGTPGVTGEGMVIMLVMMMTTCDPQYWLLSYSSIFLFLYATSYLSILSPSPCPPLSLP